MALIRRAAAGGFADTLATVDSFALVPLGGLRAGEVTAADGVPPVLSPR